MVDANGQVLGTTQLMLKGSQGINLFIPIDDALDKLSLNLQSKGSATAPK